LLGCHWAIHSTGGGQAMPDIFFKCGFCGRHFVADDAGAGIIINCPDCNTLATIPAISTPGKCPRCRYQLNFSPEMGGDSVHCPACHGEVRLPGQRYPKICPKCGVGWVPPLHRCQSCSYSMDDAGIPPLTLTDRPVPGLRASP
jgi:DNA-directed RNA polymerase subunit RPC12/RpoP